MGYFSNVKKQYFINLFQSLIPAYVIERLFWQERGMNVQMVVYCEIIYSLTVVLLEIPSGVLSDRFGRKKLLVINGALSAAEFIIILFANSFWKFALAVLLSGIGKAFSSGSENALIYDSLLCEGRQNEFEKLLGRLFAIDFAGSIAAALCGSVLANFFGFEVNYIISFFSVVMAFFLLLSLKEPPMVTRPQGGGRRRADAHRGRQRGSDEKRPQSCKFFSQGGVSVQAAAFFRTKPLVLLYCLTGAVFGACIIYLDEFWQLALGDIGVPVLFFGIISAVSLALKIPGNLLAYKLKEKFSYETIIKAIMLINITGYIAVFFTRNVFCLVPMMAVSAAAGIMEPLVAGFLHHEAESHIRATAESFCSLGLRLISILTGLAFGYISTKFSVFSGFLAIGIICAAYSAFFLIRHKAIKSENSKRS